MGAMWDRVAEKAPVNLGEVIPSKGKRRPMKFPYTFSAKIAQFPIRHHMKHSWIYKYYPLALLLSTPVFFYISRLANTPENKAKWKEIRRKELEGHEEHFEESDLE